MCPGSEGFLGANGGKSVSSKLWKDHRVGKRSWLQGGVKVSDLHAWGGRKTSGKNA